MMMIVLSVGIAKIDALALLICRICNLIEKLIVSFLVFEDLVDRLPSWFVDLGARVFD